MEVFTIYLPKLNDFPSHIYYCLVRLAIGLQSPREKLIDVVFAQHKPFVMHFLQLSLILLPETKKKNLLMHMLNDRLEDN